MARQIKMPVARITSVISSGDAPATPDTAFLAVDLPALSRTKSYAKLKAQAPHWSHEDIIAYLLAMIAEGPV